MNRPLNRIIGRLKGFGSEAWSWMSYDFANSAFATSITAVIFNKYYAGVIAGGPEGTDFNLLGTQFNLPGASLFQLSVIFGTVLTVLISPFLGIFADLSGAKKRLLILVVLIGGISTACLAFMRPGDVVAGGVFYGMALCMFLLALNLYNAFLPQICAPKDIGLVSGISWAVGYIGGGICLLLNLIMLERPQLLGFEAGTFGIGHVIISVALWWWLFSLPTFIVVRERPPRSSLSGVSASPRQVVKNLIDTFRQMKHFRQLWIFLLAYLFFINGIETTIYSASIFGDQELHMSTGSLITLFLLVQFTAFPGAIFFGYLVDLIGNKRALSIALVIWVAALIWVYNLGLIIDPIAEFHLAAVLVGLVLGGSQAASRSLFASFTPPQRSAEFFSFYGVAGRLASIMGPLSFAAVNITTRSLRHAIIAMVIFFIAGLLILFRVNEEEGIRTAGEAV
jgi:UMF1 family MFS transporter